MKGVFLLYILVIADGCRILSFIIFVELETPNFYTFSGCFNPSRPVHLRNLY